MRTHSIYSLNLFQIYHTEVLAIVIQLCSLYYIRNSYISYNWKFSPFSVFIHLILPTHLPHHWWTQIFSCVFSVTRTCSAVSDPMDCSLPGSSAHGISQVRILEWVAISFSGRSSQLRNWTHFSCLVDGYFHHWVTREAPLSLWVSFFSFLDSTYQWDHTVYHIVCIFLCLTCFT